MRAPQAEKALGDGIDEDQVFLSVVKLAERMHRLAVVGKLAVDLVGHEIQIVRHGHVEQHFHLRLRGHVPVGLPGLVIMMAFVFGVMQASMRARSA